jgi:cell division protein FtsB
VLNLLRLVFDTAAIRSLIQNLVLPFFWAACLTRAVNVDLGIWSKLSRVVVFLLCIAGLLGLALWYLPLIQENERFRKVVLQLDTQIAKAEENNRQLKISIESLRRDPKAVERLARERLGYAKPGETMIHFDETSASNPFRR